MSLNILSAYKDQYVETKSETMTIDQYLELCRTDKLAYAFPAERWLAAVGEPETFNTQSDQRYARIFGNRLLRRYKPFADFFGIEDVIESIVNYFRHNAQGLEESKQLLYLLGPVGSSKSSLAERIKELMEVHPIYVLAAEMEVDGKTTLVTSPYNCRPLYLFNSARLQKMLKTEYGVDPRYAKGVVGPWESKRLREFDGDITKFKVIKMYPSRMNQIAIANTEPGDPNTQDVSTLTGKVDIRKLEDHAQNDPDAYLFSGGLNKSGQGILDFREMFKAPIKMLNPLLFAVQEHNYEGTESFGAIPHDGIVLAHSNESEWTTFRNNKSNEAFLDRVLLVKVPYCLREEEEIAVYDKYIQGSELREAVCAPGTKQFLARFAVMTRIHRPNTSNIFSKMRVYNGENMKNVDSNAKTYMEFREDPENRDEGFFGFSTRSSFKLLSKTFNSDPEEIAADPIHLMYLLQQEIKKSELPAELEEQYSDYINSYLKPKYEEYLDKEIRTAYLEAYGEYGQNLFDRYVLWAEHWIDDQELFDAENGTRMDKGLLDAELQKIEKPAGIANPKDFRSEVVRYCLRYAKTNGGNNPDWRSYERLKEVIEKKMFTQTEDLMPVISYAPKASDEDKTKHTNFVDRMVNRGYTQKQVRFLVEWYLKNTKTK